MPIFGRGHKSGVIIRARKTGTWTELTCIGWSYWAKGLFHSSSARHCYWGGHLQPCEKAGWDEGKGVALSGSAWGTEPGEPELVAPLGGMALTFIVGGIHQADRNSDIAVWWDCLLTWSLVGWRQHWLTCSLGKYTQWGHTGRYFLSSTQVALNNSYRDSASCPWTAQFYFHFYARHQIYHFAGFIFGSTARGEERCRVVKY